MILLSYRRGIKLAGILYLHRISDNRMAGTPLSNLKVFNKLCGQDALRNIILTTTMWDQVEIDEGSEREKELCNKYWKTMIKEGSTVARFLNSTDSAWSIVEPLLRHANHRFSVLLQEEMVNMQKGLPETKAGMELYGKLDTLFSEQREVLRRIRAETGRSGNEQILVELKAEYDKLKQKLDVTIADMQALKLPLRKRLIRMLSLPLGLSTK